MTTERDCLNMYGLLAVGETFREKNRTLVDSSRHLIQERWWIQARSMVSISLKRSLILFMAKPIRSIWWSGKRLTEKKRGSDFNDEDYSAQRISLISWSRGLNGKLKTFTFTYDKQFHLGEKDQFVLVRFGLLFNKNRFSTWSEVWK